MESWKAILLLLAGAQGLLLSAALILSSIKRRPANVFLGLILIVCSIELLNAWAMPTGYHHRAHNFPFWIFSSYLILPAALWLLMQVNTDINFTIRRRYFLLFLPALIEIFTEFGAFYMYRFGIIHTMPSHYILWFLLTEVVPIILMSFVLIQYAIRLKKLYANVNNTISKTHFIQQFGFFFVFTCLTMLWIADTWLQMKVFGIIEVLLCIFLFILTYIIYFQPTFFQAPAFIKNKIVTDNYNYSAEEENVALAKLRTLMEAQKIYRTPRLTIEDVAKEVALPIRYISFLVNKYHNCNFNHYINTYRVKEVMERMKNPDESHKTLLALALESGFNSKSSFNQIFKTFTGETPSAYLAKHRKSFQNHDSGRPKAQF